MAYVARRSPGLGGLNIADILRTVADTAQTVATTARAVQGAQPAVSFATRYRWPLTIGVSALFGAAAVYLARRQRGRR